MGPKGTILGWWWHRERLGPGQRHQLYGKITTVASK